MIKLYLFGGFRAEDHTNAPLAFATNKTRSLLAYLATTPGQEHTRQFLADLLWPTSTDDVALRNLRNTLARVRKSVANPTWLLTTRQSVQLVAEPHELWSDVTTFDYLWTHLQTTTALPPFQEYFATLTEGEQVRYNINWLTMAVTLYQGEFLAGHFGQEDDNGTFWQWRRQKQEEYHAKALALLAQLTDHLLTTDDYAAAIEYARRQLALEPWREQAHCQLMQAFAGAGDTGRAFAQYEICRQILWDELTVEPNAETQALFQRFCAERKPLAGAKDNPNTLPASPSIQQPAEATTVATPTHKSHHNLPAQFTPFVGRTRELQQLREALCTSDYRLHVIAGMGGIGKSRLALQVATMTLEHWVDGVFLVPLSEVPVLDEVIPAITRTLNMPIQEELSLLPQLRTYLQDRHLLLLLDSVEHLLGGGKCDDDAIVNHLPAGNIPPHNALVTLLLDLLQAAPRLVLLVTSRYQLHVQAENLYFLEGLTYPTEVPIDASYPSGMGKIRLVDLIQFDAVNLFVKHAQRVNKQLALEEEGVAISHICQLLEGMPLGIELAAAYVQQHDCATIVTQLTQNLAHLQNNFHDLPPRQRSLLAVFEFSWGLLTPDQQILLVCCTIFQGSFARKDLSALLPGIAGPDIADRDLDELVVHCLIQRSNHDRYGLHALVQQCARQVQTALPIDFDHLAASHSYYYLTKLHGWQSEFYGLELPVVLDAVAQDWANLYAAWQWALQQGKIGWLAMALDSFFAAYYYCHHHEEGVRLWRATVNQLSNQPVDGVSQDPVLLQQLYHRLQIKQARHLLALKQIDQALILVYAILESDGLTLDLEFETLLLQGWLDPVIHEGYSRQRGTLSTQIRDQHLLGEYWRLVARERTDRGNVAEAYEGSLRALTYYESCEDYAGQTLALHTHAICCVHLEKLLEARTHLERAFQWAGPRQDIGAINLLHQIFGMVASRLGDHSAAIHSYHETLRAEHQVGRRIDRMMDMNLALEYALLGKYVEAHRHYESALKTVANEAHMERQECYIRLNYGLLYHTIGKQQAALAETERALALARELQILYLEGYALTNLGHIHCALGNYSIAESVYQAALALREQHGETILALETKAGLARLTLSTDNLTLAQEWIRPILRHLESATLDGAEEPFRVYLTCYLILNVAGDSRATSLAAQMQAELQRQAMLISDANLRDSFLTNVPYHRVIMSLVQQ
ncbi:MAG TPA: BTAD domain-containing putative transcriptional regulator [Caldilineaceae bacterium]|nr:BTAD domain-containing putative transcriptional regulator [Caldilineaceae bacterium]